MSVAIVGLGYVGLPLAVEFGKRRPTIGFDRSRERIEAIAKGLDRTGEMKPEELRSATHLRATSDAAALKEADYIIVAVPTPVDKANRPDLAQLLDASRTVGKSATLA